MPDEAFNWMARLKGVEREYRAVRFGTDYLLQDLRGGRSGIEQAPQTRDLVGAIARLEATYVVRLFSEFESSLERYLQAFALPASRTVRRRIERIRAHRKLPESISGPVHEVRGYRNDLVHSLPDPVEPLTIRFCTSSLCTFLSCLQRYW
jgi:hypothetical protein